MLQRTVRKSAEVRAANEQIREEFLGEEGEETRPIEIERDGLN